MLLSVMQPCSSKLTDVKKHREAGQEQWGAELGMLDADPTQHSTA